MRMDGKTQRILLAALCGALLLVGCGRTINRTAERKIRDALPDVLGPAKRYRAHVENPPERTLQGRLATITIDGDDVEVANGLLLDQLHLELKGVEIDTGRRQVRRIQETVNGYPCTHYVVEGKTGNYVSKREVWVTTALGTPGIQVAAW